MNTQLHINGKVIDLKDMPAWKLCRAVNAERDMAAFVGTPLLTAFENIAQHMLDEKWAYLRRGRLVPMRGEPRS